MVKDDSFFIRYLKQNIVKVDFLTIHIGTDISNVYEIQKYTDVYKNNFNTIKSI